MNRLVDAVRGVTAGGLAALVLSVGSCGGAVDLSQKRKIESGIYGGTIFCNTNITSNIDGEVTTEQENYSIYYSYTINDSGIPIDETSGRAYFEGLYNEAEFLGSQGSFLVTYIDIVDGGVAAHANIEINVITPDDNLTLLGETTRKWNQSREQTDAINYSDSFILSGQNGQDESVGIGSCSGTLYK